MVWGPRKTVTCHLSITYDPSVGVYGLDFHVVTNRPGFVTADKKHRQATLRPNRINEEEAQRWFQYDRSSFWRGEGV